MDPQPISVRGLFAIVGERYSPPTHTALIVLLAGVIASGELLLYFDYVGPAMWVHFGTLLLCILLPLKLNGQTPIIKAFVLLPVFRLVNLGMPVFFNITVLWFPVVYGPLIPAVYLIGQDLDVSVTRGWRYAVFLAPVAIPASALMAAIEFSIITPTPLVTTDSLFEVALITLVMVLFVGFVEEFLYRAILQRTLTDYIGVVPALLLANALFGLMHSGYGDPFEILFAGVLGLVYGILYRYTDSLLLVTILHGLLNTFLFGIYPLGGAVFGLPFGGVPVGTFP